MDSLLSLTRVDLSQARLGDLDMSDDDTVPAAPGQIVEVHSDEVDTQSQDSGEPMEVLSIWQ